MYMTSRADLQQAVHTAVLHCKPGGVVFLAPDCTQETFRPGTDHGGHDGPQRGLRYLEWTWDPDPTDSQFLVDYAYLLREADGSVRSLYDRHVNGLFSQAEWLEVMQAEGLRARVLPFEHSQIEPGATVMFMGLKTRSSS